MDNETLFPALRRFGGNISNAVLTGSLGDTFDLERFKRDNPETMKYREGPRKRRKDRSEERPRIFPPSYRPFGEKTQSVIFFARKYVVIGIKTQSDIDRWAEHIPKIVDYASGEPTVPVHVHQPETSGFRLDPVLGHPSISNIVAIYRFPHHFNLAKLNAEHLVSCRYKPLKFPGCSCTISKRADGSKLMLIVFETGMVNSMGARNNGDFETINKVLATFEDYAAAPRGGDTAVAEELDEEFKRLTLNDDWTLSVALSEQFENLALEEQVPVPSFEKLPPRGMSIVHTREKERIEWIKIVRARNKETKN